MARIHPTAIVEPGAELDDTVVVGPYSIVREHVRIAAGTTIALVSDAGMPLVSDPGYRLVQEAIAAGVKVEPVPGPPSNRRSWSLPEVLSRLDARLGPEEARALDMRRFATLSDEERYALFKLADPARDPARLRAALLELGFGDGAPPTVRCSRSLPNSSIA